MNSFALLDRPLCSVCTGPALQVLVVVMALAQTAQATVYTNSQMVGFATGNLGTVGTAEGWGQGAAYCTVTSGSGSLDGTPFGLTASAGDKANVTAGGNSTYLLFSAASQLNQTANHLIYFSFLYRVNTTNGMPPTGTNIMKISRQNSSTYANGHQEIWLKPDGLGNVQVGTCINQGTPVFASTLIPVGQTFLIVARDQIKTSADNDVADVWVNPPYAKLGVDELSVPTPDATTDSGVEDPSSTGAGRLVVYGYGGSANFDEVRMASTWAEVTPAASCTSASVTNDPASISVFAGNTATFTVVASGTVLSYQWQVSTNSGSTWDNIGANASSYTTPVLATSDSGKQYRCVVTAGCNNSTATSGTATLTVADGSLYWFRTASAGTSGDWSNSSTWEQSTDGSTWSATAFTPSYANSNILIRSGYTVTVSTLVQVDQTAVQAGGQISINGGTLTLAHNAASAFDLDVAGTLELDSNNPLVFNASATIRVSGSYKWNANAAPTLTPAASTTWADGSTCLITNTSSSGTSDAINASGHSFYDFTIAYPSVGQRTRLGWTGTTTIRRNFAITIPDVASASVMLAGGNAVVTVGGNVTFVTGTTATSTKILTKHANGDVVTLQVAGNFSATGYLDAFGTTGGAVTTIELNGTGAQSLAIPPTTAGLVANGNKLSFLVDAGCSTTLSSPIPVCATFTNNGNLYFSTNQIQGGTVAFNNGGTTHGNGTNQLTTGLASINYGGTLDLPGLPTFSGGESFLLFGSTARSGVFSAFSPANPPGTGLTWDTSTLATDGFLRVFNGSATPKTPTITSIAQVQSGVRVSGTNGTPSGSYSVIVSPDVSLPRASWTTNQTGQFAADGTFSFTNAISSPNQFISVKQP
jgi:hypothetical protein